MHFCSFDREDGIVGGLAVNKHEQGVLQGAITIAHIALIDVWGVIAT